MLLFEALGADAPRYAHLPLILGPDKQKLSKRHGAVAVEWFREQGYVADAVVNYLALLGWSPGEDREILPRDELVGRFDLEHVSHHPAVFDVEKLTWMNGNYIRGLADDELAARILPLLVQAGIGADIETVRSAVPFVKERMRTLNEAVGLLRFLFEDVSPDEDAQKLIEKAGGEYLRDAALRLESVEDWTAEEVTAVLDELASGANLSRTKAWQPIRAAVTGSRISPPLPESIALLGRERTVDRLRNVWRPEPNVADRSGR
jgi:glutamyl-tRNA synthetase